MISNDRIILDQVLEQKRSEIAPDLSASAYFEIFTAEQVLKDYDLSYPEIESGIVGNGGDGGIDSIYTFVNGELLREDSDLSFLKKNINIELYLIQSKTSATFSEEVLHKLTAVTEDLLNLSHSLEDYTTVYNEDLLLQIKLFRNNFELLASRFPSLRLHYIYASHGESVHPNVDRKVKVLENATKNLFTSSDFQFQFLGSKDLLTLARRAPKTTYPLTLAENPISSEGEVGFICLVSLHDYYKFITDENGDPLRNIFEANVRDYQGSTEVNEQIQRSLNDPGGEDFWWLNNGVTIVASQATQSGKTLRIEDPEVVNGLQTSTEIVNYFTSTSNLDKRKILVRIIVPGKPESRDHIIKATNSQTKIPQASLRATDKVHRDIEEFFRPHGLYYDRRKNFYKNEGKPIDRIVSIPSLAQAGMSIFLQRPDNARARPSSLLKKDEDYKRLFNSEHPVNIYLFCAQVMRNVDAFLKSQAADMPLKDRNNLRFYIAMHATAMIAQSAHPSLQTLASINISSISDSTLQVSTQIIRPLYENLGGNDQAAKGPDLLKDIIKDLEHRFPTPIFNGMT